jgi:hypothetical protein
MLAARPEAAAGSAPITEKQLSVAEASDRPIVHRKTRQFQGVSWSPLHASKTPPRFQDWAKGGKLTKCHRLKVGTAGFVRPSASWCLTKT